jgi:glycosyltransferase involved in cell wall biosynthesis
MKLLFIIPEYPPGFGGGIATFYATLLPALVKQGLSVTAVVGSALAAGPIAYTDQGVEVIPLDQTRVTQLTGRFTSFALAPDFSCHLAAAWTAWEQTNGGRGFDCVECCDWGLSFVPWLTQSGAPPTRVRLHASAGQIALWEPQPGFALTESLFQLAETLLLPYAAELVTFGQGNQQWWRSRLNTTVAHLNPAFTPPAPTERRPQTPNALVVGRIQSWKGPDTLCRALTELGSAAPQCDWIGRSTVGPDGRDTTARLTEQFPEIWGHRVRPLDPLPPIEIRQRQASASFVIVPSDWDVFNFTAVEAMSAHALVICSSGAGASSLIQHGVNGFVFPSGDHGALAEAIRTIHRLSPEERQRIGQAAHDTVTDALLPEKIARLEMAHLQSIVTGPRRSNQGAELNSIFAPVELKKEIPGQLACSGLSRIPLAALCRHVVSRISQRLLGKP